MDNFFIDALVRASLCKYHSSSLPSIGAPARSRTICTIRRVPSSPHHNFPIIDLVPRPPFSPEIKSELKSFSDPYYDESYDDAKSAKDEDEDGPPPKPYPNDPKAAVRPPLPWHACTTPESHAALRRFKRHLADPKCSHETLYRSYRALPTPQILHLQLHHVNAFVARMMTVPQRTEPAMLRYLAVLDDLRAAALPITRAEYNAAISFVARSFDSVSLDEAKSAIHLWKKSEGLAGVASDITTFNILLDMASKSDTPVLVEWILREIESRGMAPDRFTHTTLITYHGLRGDGEGVRLAYRELVDAGEIVDTVVLNAVMAAFLRAGQPQSADYIYENMKRATLDPPHPLPQAGPGDWVGKRKWAKVLKAVAERRRRIIGGYMKDFNASLAPDVYTFNMVVLQSAKTGDYERAMALFREMDLLGVRANETIFVALLKGFYWYGGMSHTPWTPERLEEVVALAFDKKRNILMEKSLAKWILMSTARVYNSKELVLKIWPKITKRWVRQGGEVDPETREVLKGLVGHGKGA
jgi:pentatricopeptide repeat protein